MPLADVIYRIATDADFAAQFQQEPETTLAAAGLSLGEEDIAAVLAVMQGLGSLGQMSTEGIPWPLAQFEGQPSLDPSSQG